MVQLKEINDVIEMMKLEWFDMNLWMQKGRLDKIEITLCKIKEWINEGILNVNSWSLIVLETHLN